nr:hypothetical protein [Tanacetum cinerariifolium]
GPLGKFDEKADDGFFLGCSLVAKAFRDSVFSEELLEFTVADDHPAPNELDQPESVMYQAKESHLVAVKRIFRKSTFVACQILDGKLVCWSANKQSSVAMSSAEDEYVAAIVIVLRSFNVKSYQKKINVTKPETTKFKIRKRDPYTLYQDPQGFIYVDDNGRIRLMRSDELYKFSDGTLTRLRTSLDEITKNIRMEYSTSTLEKNIQIKAFDKQLKERRMLRSLKKFVGERDYETDLRLLQ